MLPLSAAPYRFSHNVIGAFGLLGAPGALAATHAGRLAGRRLERQVTLGALLLLLLAWLPLALMPVSLWALVIGNMLFYAVGSGLGAMASTLVYAHAGWTGACLRGSCISLAALLFWAATRKMSANRDCGGSN